jgi:hypothetical protein
MRVRRRERRFLPGIGEIERSNKKGPANWRILFESVCLRRLVVLVGAVDGLAMLAPSFARFPIMWIAGLGFLPAAALAGESRVGLNDGGAPQEETGGSDSQKQFLNH